MKRIFACLFVMAVLPLMASPDRNGSTNAVPFVAVVYAGHSTMGGGWCNCPSPGCVCDANEPHGMQPAPPVSDRDDRTSNHDGASAGTEQTTRFDFASSGLMLALALFLWTRLRT